MGRKTHGRQAYLAAHADEGFLPPDHWTADLITLAELKRVAANAQIAAVASLVPRRLGDDASNMELAGDKFLSRGLSYIYLSLWGRLTVTADDCDIRIDGKIRLRCPADLNQLMKRAIENDDFVREGATIDWPTWWRTLDPRLRSRRRALATYALRRVNGDVVKDTALTWGYRICYSIERELADVTSRFAKWEKKYHFENSDGLRNKHSEGSG